MGRNSAVVSGVALLFFALALLVFPLRWLGAMILAITVHEGCHYLAVRLCGGTVRQIRIGINGMSMQIGHLNSWQELICALAGPVGGLLLLFVARWLPRTAICGAFQGLFNLLPIYPLDGGRAIRCASALLISQEISDRFCDAVEMLCLVGILCLGLYGTFRLCLGLMPIGIAALLLQRSFAGKRPCKPGWFSVQ